MIYFIILLLLIVLSYNYDVKGLTRNKNIWYLLILIIFVLVAGLRYRVGVDTTKETYIFYHETPALSKAFLSDLSFFQYPIWKLLNSFIYTIGGKWYWIQIIQSSFVNILLFHYFKKHSQYFFTCIFFYYIWLYAAINFEEMKASFALVISLYSYDYIIDKKIVKGLLLLVVACMFHISAILVVPFAFMTFLRANITGVCLLVCSILIGYILSRGIEDYLVLFEFDDFVASKAEDYAESDRFFSREGKNYMFYIVRVFPYLFYPIAALWYVKGRNKTTQMLKLEPYLMTGLIMVGISGSIIIFYRYVNFYIPIFIIFMSQCIVDITKSQHKLSLGVSSVRSCLMFSFFFLNIIFGYMGGRFSKFYPYSSVIERKVYKSKEKVFNENTIVPSPNHNEY